LLLLPRPLSIFANGLSQFLPIFQLLPLIVALATSQAMLSEPLRHQLLPVGVSHLQQSVVGCSLKDLKHWD
jgi:hypothetical protein